MLSLSEVKSYLRIEHTEDDVFIATLLTAATDYVEIAMNRNLDDVTWDVPETINIAQLMLISHWYENRAIVSEKRMHEVPLTVKSLLSPHRMVSF